MASFKGDGRYRSYYDDVVAEHRDSDSDEATVTEATGTPERVWVEKNYEILQELYRHFRESGEKAFGYAFFQGGGFHDFIHLIYRHTHIF
jgi:hypothetical protein